MGSIYKHGYFHALTQDKSVQELFKMHSDLGLPDGNTKNLYAILSKNIEDRRIADLGIAMMQAEDRGEKRKLLVELLANKTNPLAIPVLASASLILREIGLSGKSAKTVFEHTFEGRVTLDVDERFEDTEAYPFLMIRGFVGKDGKTSLTCTSHPGEEEAERTTAQSDDDDILTIIVRPRGRGFWGWLKNAVSSLFGGSGGGSPAPTDPFMAAFLDIVNAAYDGAQVGAFVSGTGLGFGGMIIGGVFGSPAGPGGVAEGAAIGGTIGAVYGGAQGAFVGGVSAGLWRLGEHIYRAGTNVVEFPNGQSDSEATLPGGFPGLGSRQTSTRDVLSA